MLLYHGSHTHFDTIDLQKGRLFKDFGQGFYTTLFQDQAENWARVMAARIGTNQGFVSIYEVSHERFIELNYLLFDKPSEDWAYFIMHNRARSYTNKTARLQNHSLQYDIVEGPVANDNIAVVLDQFMMNMKSGTALVEALEYKNLSHQISFHTQRALELLRLVEYYAVKP
jgi:hypothetical protein